MGNLGGLELLVIMVVALIVLGPQKLPEATRKVGKFLGEVKRVSESFQEEMRHAAEDSTFEVSAKAKQQRTSQASPEETKSP